jgi:hypothetical protein
MIPQSFDSPFRASDGERLLFFNDDAVPSKPRPSKRFIG